jgi:hypothetical protein
MLTSPFIAVLPRGVVTHPDGSQTPSYYEEYLFTIRSVNRREYQQWQVACPDISDLEEKIIQEGVISHPESFAGQPWEWGNVLAGLFQQVLDGIIAFSGLGENPDPQITEDVQAYLKSEEAKIDLMIMTAFNYKYEELLEMDARTYQILTGQAYRKLCTMGIDPALFLDPENTSQRKAASPSGPPAHVPGMPAAPVRGWVDGKTERRDEQENFVFTSN